jgi:hypothetical protein
MSDELYRTITAGNSYPVKPVALTGTAADGIMIETTFWPGNATTGADGLATHAGTVAFELQMAFDASTQSQAAPALTVRVEPKAQQLQLLSAAAVLATFDASALDCGVHTDGWNMLRVLLKRSTPSATGAAGTSGQSSNIQVAVWLNPMFGDAFVGPLPVPGGPDQQIRLMPPRINISTALPAWSHDESPTPTHVALPGISNGANSNSSATTVSISIAAAGAPARIDYVSVLPPRVFGEAFNPQLDPCTTRH